MASRLSQGGPDNEEIDMDTSHDAFSARFEAMRQKIAEMPEEQRVALESLARETEQRDRTRRREIDAAWSASRQLAVLQELESLGWASINESLDEIDTNI